MGTRSEIVGFDREEAVTQNPLITHCQLLLHSMLKTKNYRSVVVAVVDGDDDAVAGLDFHRCCCCY